MWKASRSIFMWKTLKEVELLFGCLPVGPLISQKFVYLIWYMCWFHSILKSTKYWIWKRAFSITTGFMFNVRLHIVRRCMWNEITMCAGCPNNLVSRNVDTYRIMPSKCNVLHTDFVVASSIDTMEFNEAEIDSVWANMQFDSGLKMWRSAKSIFQF